MRYPDVKRIVCAIMPFGAPEEIIRSTIDSNSIIGYDQYLLLSCACSDVRIELYDEREQYGPGDVLLIMSTIWVFPLDKLCDFQGVVYFYDDNSVKKAKTDQYQKHFDHVDLVLHPDPVIVSDLRNYWSKPTFHVAYSSGTLPEGPVVKSARCSFFVDMDERYIVADTVERGLDFIRHIAGSGFDIYVPAGFGDRIPAHLKEVVEEVPRMAHDRFLEFLSGITFYVSGIYGSYEYSVLESALLGCGLISLNDAVRKLHHDRCGFLSFPVSGDFISKLEKEIDIFDADRIRADARKLYPGNAAARIPELIRETMRRT